MTARAALLVCPGRGSYDRSSLGGLAGRSPAAQAIIDACDAWRADHGRPTVSALDAAPSFRSKEHVAGENASLLTFAAALADLAELDQDRYEIVGVAGNSMGFYTALAASEALPLEAAIRLVDTMGVWQEGNVVGGQLLYPLSDGIGPPDPERLALVEREVVACGAAWSIRLGSYAVLGGDEAACAAIAAALPPITRGERTFPVRLPLHSAFHTPWMAPTRDRAVVALADLPFQAPAVPLIDGRGQVWRPRWADPVALRDYTLDAQVVAPYDFTTSVRTALRHTGAEVVIVLGPGNSLGAPLASVLVTEGWRGLRSREAFDAAQASDDPVLLSFGVSQQRSRLVAG
jgi:[acyl-carrier-protein] S-malonyltransferase